MPLSFHHFEKARSFVPNRAGRQKTAFFKDPLGGAVVRRRLRLHTGNKGLLQSPDHSRTDCLGSVALTLIFFENTVTDLNCAVCAKAFETQIPNVRSVP